MFGDDEFGSDWGQFFQFLLLWQDVQVFGSGYDGYGEFCLVCMLVYVWFLVLQWYVLQCSMDMVCYNLCNLFVLDDVDDEVMMDDIVGVVVDVLWYVVQCLCCS